MCKVVCQKCGHSFVVAGIVPKTHDCFCSVQCLRESLQESGVTAFSVEFLSRAPEPRTFADYPFPARNIGLLAL